MKRVALALFILVGLELLLMAGANPALAQDGKLALKVAPAQAYIFVDGRAIGEASKHHTLKLTGGDHKIDVVNYGYAPASRTVTITAGQTANLEVSLTAVASPVSSPFGAMTIEGAPRAAVLLNGKTPEFFVGHVDEFNHDWWWKQELVVPPGSYQVTVRQDDKDLWSGSVDVPAGKRVVIDGGGCQAYSGDVCQRGTNQLWGFLAGQVELNGCTARRDRASRFGGSLRRTDGPTQTDHQLPIDGCGSWWDHDLECNGECEYFSASKPCAIAGADSIQAYRGQDRSGG